MFSSSCLGCDNVVNSGKVDDRCGFCDGKNAQVGAERTHRRIYTQAHTQALSLYLSYTHTRAHTHTHSRSLFLSLSLSHTHNHRWTSVGVVQRTPHGASTTPRTNSARPCALQNLRAAWVATWSSIRDAQRTHVGSVAATICASSKRSMSCSAKALSAG